jgi:hypothetical protein
MRQYLNEHKGFARGLIVLIAILVGLLSISLWGYYQYRQDRTNPICIEQLYGIECENGFVTYTPQDP